MQQSFATRQSKFSSKGIFVAGNSRRLVLDTNVALDLLVFCDPVCQPLAQQLQSGAWQWLATPPMRAEFDDVLRRPAFERWAPRREAIAALWQRWACMVEPSVHAAPEEALRCRDPDDQMFVDFALALRPSQLLSRDREVLSLASAASAFDVWIGTPAQMLSPSG
jgi:uncharacterized protein